MATDNEKLWVVRKVGMETGRTSALYLFRTRAAARKFSVEMSRGGRSSYSRPIPAKRGPEQ